MPAPTKNVSAPFTCFNSILLFLLSWGRILLLSKKPDEAIWAISKGTLGQHHVLPFLGDFFHCGCDILAVPPPNLLPTPSLLAGRPAEKALLLCQHCSAIATASLCIFTTNLKRSATGDMKKINSIPAKTGTVGCQTALGVTGGTCRKGITIKW